MSADKPNLNRLLELEKTLLSFRMIKRIIHIEGLNGIEQENDTEHSYDLAMSCWYLARFFDDLDVDKVIRLAMVHDLVEIHAGDTFTFGTKEHLDSKVSREYAAYEQIKQDWPDFDALHESIAEYESRDSNEARFVYAMDKLMADLVLYLNNGHTWKTHNITQEMLFNNKQHKVALHPGVAHYYNQLHELLTEHSDRLFVKREGQHE